MKLSKEYLKLRDARLDELTQDRVCTVTGKLVPVTPLPEEYKKKLAKAVRYVNKASVKPVGTKTLKSCTIEAEFAELKMPRMHQVGRGRATNLKAAAANAMRDLLKQPGLKAQRFTLCKATISFGTVTVEETNGKP